MRQKKLTRKDKQRLASLGICWKCGQKTLVREKNLLVCKNNKCNFSFLII